MADIPVTVYSSGASFQKGALKVTDTGVVENLNAKRLQGKEPADFVKTTGFGITQNTGAIEVNNLTISKTGVSEIFDSSSQIKIGNVVIKASDNNGILIGIE